MQIKTIAVSFLLIAICLAPLEELSAAPSNGTRFPKTKEVELGYEYNVMFKRTLEGSYGDLQTQDNFYTVSFGVCDWFCLDGQIGIGDLDDRRSSHLPKLEFSTGFAGGYGFRIKAFDYKKWGIRAIIGGQHICVHPQVRSVNDDKYQSILDDWQVSGLVAKDFRNLTVYAGMKGSDCELIYKINKHDYKRRFSENHIGLISGLELYLFKNKARVNIESRFFDETALSASASYLF